MSERGTHPNEGDVHTFSCKLCFEMEEKRQVEFRAMNEAEKSPQVLQYAALGVPSITSNFDAYTTKGLNRCLK